MECHNCYRLTYTSVSATYAGQKTVNIGNFMQKTTIRKLTLDKDHIFTKLTAFVMASFARFKIEMLSSLSYSIQPVRNVNEDHLGVVTREKSVRSG